MDSLSENNVHTKLCQNRSHGSNIKVEDMMKFDEQINALLYPRKEKMLVDFWNKLGDFNTRIGETYDFQVRHLRCVFSNQ
jgi:hypothetical protein